MTKRPKSAAPSINVAAFRQAQQMTLRELADALEVDTSTIWRWEHYGLPTRGLALKTFRRFAESHDPAAG
jgi:transcriptional regulator with XRE-family HTH domain